ncbi:Caspase domain [Trypanosoma vivax]|nr:Caspase domain [Trypanosoma vivax]
MSQPSSGCFCCGGTSGSLNLAGLAEQLALNASPYNVPSVGTVARPHGVDVDALMRDAASIRGTKPWNAPGRPSGEVRGLFIGINYYGTSAQLSGCCNDVKQVLGTLQKCGMPITSANILVDEDGFPGRSGQPTRHNILRHLAWLVLGAKPGDRALPLLRRTRHADQGPPRRGRGVRPMSPPRGLREKRLHPGQRRPQGASVAPARGGAADRGVRLLPLGHDDGPGLQVRLQCLLRSAVRGPHGAHPRGERREGGCADGVRLRRRPDVRRRARHGNSGHGIHGRGRCDHSVPDVHDPEQDDGVIQRPVPRHARHAPSQRVHADPAAVRVQAAGPAATVFTDE